MDSKELLSLLMREGFNRALFRLEAVHGGEGSDDCFCLRSDGRRWEVCYLERGASRTLGTFSDEASACDEFLRRLEQEGPSARSHLLTGFPNREEADRLVALLLQAGIQPTHRDAPAFAHRNDIRYRVFVDGRYLQQARKVLDDFVESAADLSPRVNHEPRMPG